MIAPLRAESLFPLRGERVAAIRRRTFARRRAPGLASDKGFCPQADEGFFDPAGAVDPALDAGHSLTVRASELAQSGSFAAALQSRAAARQIPCIRAGRAG
jgi:hypothetical protein